MIIKQCKCGSKDFVYEETVQTWAFLDDKGNLVDKNDGSTDSIGVNSVNCADCGEEYSLYDFNQIGVI